MNEGINIVIVISDF